MNNINEQILQLHKNGLNTDEISKSLEIFPYKVRKTLNTYGIYLGHKTPFKANPSLFISDKLEEIINGSMLGDGFMYRHVSNSGRKNCNSRLMINYSCVNQEYGKYIKNLIESTGVKVYDRVSFRKNPSVINNRIVSDNGLYTIYTEQNVAFNKYRDVWYEFGIKSVPSEIKLTPLSIAIWFQDDGYYHKSAKSYFFCTDCFAHYDLKILQNILLNQYGVKTSVTQKRRLYIRKESAVLFKSILEPHVCSTMKYKLN